MQILHNVVDGPGPNTISNNHFALFNTEDDDNGVHVDDDDANNIYE